MQVMRKMKSDFSSCCCQPRRQTDVVMATAAALLLLTLTGADAQPQLHKGM